jgi:hypothetical protein
VLDANRRRLSGGAVVPAARLNVEILKRDGVGRFFQHHLKREGCRGTADALRRDPRYDGFPVGRRADCSEADAGGSGIEIIPKWTDDVVRCGGGWQISIDR